MVSWAPWFLEEKAKFCTEFPVMCCKILWSLWNKQCEFALDKKFSSGFCLIVLLEEEELSTLRAIVVNNILKAFG